jgi:hypothetical protein
MPTGSWAGTSVLPEMPHSCLYSVIFSAWLVFSVAKWSNWSSVFWESCSNYNGTEEKAKWVKMISWKFLLPIFPKTCLIRSCLNFNNYLQARLESHVYLKSLSFPNHIEFSSCMRNFSFSQHTSLTMML